MSELSIDVRMPAIDSRYLRYAVYGLAVLVGANVMLASCGKPNNSGGGGGTHSGGKYTGKRGYGGSKNTNSGGWNSLAPVPLDDGSNTGSIPGYSKTSAAHIGLLPDRLVSDPQQPDAHAYIVLGGAAVLLPDNLVQEQDVLKRPAE